MVRQLSSLDGAFLYNDTRNTPESIGSVMIHDPGTARDGFVRFKDILRTYETRLSRSPTFTRKMMRVPMDFDHPYWIEDENFDLEYHVRHIALPKPGDWRQLCILIARLHSHPLDLDRPLWQSWVIEGLDNIEGVPKGCFAHFIRFHHAAFDGMAAADFIYALHDAKPVFPEGEYRSDPKKRITSNKPGLPEMVARGYTNFLKQQLELVKIGAKAIPKVSKERQFLKDHDLEKIPKKPITRFDANVSPNRVWAALEFPMSKIKEIRQAVPGTTVNDVAVAIFSRAIRKYLSGKDELPYRSLLSIVPVSNRKQEQVDDKANDISALIVPLHTDIDDPLELLAKLKDTIAKHKLKREELGEPTFWAINSALPSLAQVGLGRSMGLTTKFGLQFSPVNTTITNVPGPRVPLYFAGAKGVKNFSVGIVTHGMGLFNVVSSYCENLTMSFIACRDMMPNPQTYEAAIKESFEDIYAAAKAKTESDTPKKAAKKKPARAKKAAS